MDLRSSTTRCTHRVHFIQCMQCKHYVQMCSSISAMHALHTLYTLNMYIRSIVHFANIVSFTKQLQNRAYAAKVRQADSKLFSASFPYPRNHGYHNQIERNSYICCKMPSKSLKCTLHDLFDTPDLFRGCQTFHISQVECDQLGGVGLRS